MDARALGVAHGVPRRASMSWLLVRARPQMTGPFDLARDRLDGLEVAGRGDREAGLDDVDAEARRAAGRSRAFPRMFMRDAGRLLAVAQRRVEDQDAIGLVASRGVLPAGCSCRSCSFSTRLTFLSAGYAATRPPRAIPPEGGAGEAGEASCPTTSARRVARPGADGRSRARTRCCRGIDACCCRVDACCRQAHARCRRGRTPHRHRRGDFGGGVLANSARFAERVAELQRRRPRSNRRAP